MKDNYANRLFDECMTSYPYACDRCAGYFTVSPDRLVMNAVNGDMYIYNSLAGTIRRYPAEDDLRCEMVWRKRFRDALNDILFEQGVTQKDLAERCDITPAAISSYMHCSATPSAFVIDKIARALDCSIDDLLVYI